MAKWGARAAAAFVIAMLAGLLATTMATGATAQPSGGDLSVEASLAGDGTDVEVWVSGCTPGGFIRLWIDGYPFPDQQADGNGNLHTVIDVPDWLKPILDYATVKAYCFDTDGALRVPIQDPTDPGDPPDDNGGNGGGLNPWDRPDCVFWRAIDIGLDSDTWEANADWELVILWTQVFDEYTLHHNVSQGDLLSTNNGKKILKIGACGEGTGYTPDQLQLTARKVFGQDGKIDIEFRLLGCPSGAQVGIWHDTVFINRFVVGPNDELLGRYDSFLVPNWVTTAQCEDGRRISAPIDVSFGWPPSGSLSPVIQQSLSIVPVLAEPAVDEAVKAKLLAETEQAQAAQIALAGAQASQSTTLPTLDVDPSANATVGAGAGVTAAAQYRSVGDASTATGKASGGFPTAQAGFGVLAGAGLLAFLGLRRVARNTPTGATETRS